MSFSSELVDTHRPAVLHAPSYFCRTRMSERVRLPLDFGLTFLSRISSERVPYTLQEASWPVNCTLQLCFASSKQRPYTEWHLIFQTAALDLPRGLHGLYFL